MSKELQDLHKTIDEFIELLKAKKQQKKEKK